jgi:hypothetical protein
MNIRLKAAVEYPFSSDVKIKIIHAWWESLPAQVLGIKYHEFYGRYEILAYYYKDILYIKKYGVRYL